MRVRPVVVRTRYKIALRFGVAALAAAWHQHVAPAIARAIGASKPAPPKFTAGGYAMLPREEGEEYIIWRRK